ncbi:MAG TPA: hypothetical protein PLN52_03680 [Opitutaceae bacterium]|nr:hypothetical protein [Opitutaceae bacterium]
MNRWTSSSLSTAGTPAELEAQTVRGTVSDGWPGSTGSLLSLFAGVALASISVLVCAVVMLASALLSFGKRDR